MAKTVILITLLRIMMILLFSVWILLWFLKPTKFWSEIWKRVEDSMHTTIFKYNGADFVVCTFPIVLLAMFGLVYMYFKLQQRIQSRRRLRRYLKTLYNPVIVKSPLGVLSGTDVIGISLAATLLVWTFYARISNDYKKLEPVKHLKLSIWQLKFLKMSTRFGLMAEICLGFLLFPVLRGLSIFRLIGVQFEASVRYHIWLGTTLVVFAVLHGGGTLFIWGINHQIQNQIWSWQKEGRIYLAGAIALVALMVIWMSSLPSVRRTRFDVFFYMHHLYAVFLVFFLFHAGDKHFYMVFAGVFLFAVDKLLRVTLSSPSTRILSVKIFPNKIIELTFPKDPKLKYTPTSIIFIKIPMVSKFDWHPFSIASSSTVNDHTMSVMIKCAGCWTNSLYDILSKELIESGSKSKCIPVAVEGPYGPVSFDFIRYDSLILIAGGIGITPMLSILREIASADDVLRDRHPIQLHLIYVTKKSQDMSILNPISHILLNQSSEFYNIKLRVFVTQEEKGAPSIRELLNSLSMPRTILFDLNKNSSYSLGTRHANLLWMGAIIAFSSVTFLLSLCFFNQFIVTSKQKSSKPKSPSSVVDLFLFCSFLIAVACSALVAMALRWRYSRREHATQSKTDDGDEVMNLSAMERASATSLEEHEIHYGTRPIFKELLTKMEGELRGSNVGVVVCGPESLKESVASAFTPDSKHKQQHFFVFHSLNFSL